jgi:hypothetical protein
MRLPLQFFSCIFRHFRNSLTGEHGRTCLREIMHMKGILYVPLILQQLAAWAGVGLVN